MHTSPMTLSMSAFDSQTAVFRAVCAGSYATLPQTTQASTSRAWTYWLCVLRQYSLPHRQAPGMPSGSRTLPHAPHATSVNSFSNEQTGHDSLGMSGAGNGSGTICPRVRSRSTGAEPDPGGGGCFVAGDGELDDISIGEPALVRFGSGDLGLRAAAGVGCDGAVGGALEPTPEDDAAVEADNSGFLFLSPPAGPASGLKNSLMDDCNSRSSSLVSWTASLPNSSSPHTLTRSLPSLSVMALPSMSMAAARLSTIPLSSSS